MAAQGLTATAAPVKLGRRPFSRSYSSSPAGALRLLSPAHSSLSQQRNACPDRKNVVLPATSVRALRGCASTCSRGVAAGRSSAAAAPAVPAGSEEQVEAVRSLNGWVADNKLPLLSPVESAWQPHDFLPVSTTAAAGAEAEAFTEGLAELRVGAACLPDDVLVCLVGNMITEAALPTYQSMGNRTEGARDETGSSKLPWARWIRGWTAEENRHGDLLNRYLYLTGRVDMRQVEVTVHHLLRNGMEMLAPASPYHSLIYGAFQERATFISHGHTARHGDRALAKICGVIAADERRHEAGYTMVSAKLLEVDPDGVVRALADVMRGKVTMPGLLMSDGREGAGGGDDTLFARFSAVAQRAGVYTASNYGDLVEHFVRRTSRGSPARAAARRSTCAGWRPRSGGWRSWRS